MDKHMTWADALGLLATSPDKHMTWADWLGLPLGIAVVILAIFLGFAACIWAENQGNPRNTKPPEKKP